MNFFDMGMLEIGLILLVALLVFGPGSIPKVASQLGKAVRAFRKITTDLSKDFAKALDTEDKEPKTTPKTERKTEPKPESIEDMAKKAVKNKATKTLDKFLGDSDEESG
jgi:sec-independent protein translocase protein TatA